MMSYAALAVLEEGRLARSISEVAREFRTIPEAQGGGVMCRGEPGTWVNVGVGIGLQGAVPGELLDELVAWFEEVGAEPRVELCPTADDSLIRGLGERGFRVGLFENVFFRPLLPEERTAPVHEPPGDVTIEQLDPADAAAVEAFARTVGFGFAGDSTPREADLELWRKCAAHPRTVVLVARQRGGIVGAGSVEVLDEQAALFGLSVLPESRGQGIQQAIMAARLNLAAERGATVATISARPGVATERNARRLGFQLGYTKAVMVRPGPGLATVVG